LCLADDFWATGKHLATVEDSCRYVRTAMERGYDINIRMKVPHGSDRVSQASS
jgi:hypothetical protein